MQGGNAGKVSGRDKGDERSAEEVDRSLWLMRVERRNDWSY